MKMKKLSIGLLVSALVLGGSMSVFAASNEGKELVGKVVATVTSSTQAITFDKDNLPDGVTFMEKVDLSDKDGDKLGEFAAELVSSEEAIYIDKVELDSIDGIEFDSSDKVDFVVDGKPVE